MISCMKSVFFIYMIVILLPCDKQHRLVDEIKELVHENDSKMRTFNALELCTDGLCHEFANITTIGGMMQSLPTFDEMAFEFELFAKEIEEFFSEMSVGCIEIVRDIVFSAVRSLPDFPKLARRLISQGILHIRFSPQFE